MEGFERFTVNHRSSFPMVSAYGHGVFGFNVTAIKQFNLDQFNFCSLYFDAERGLIGFEFLVEPDDFCFKITKLKSRFTIACRCFARHHKLKLSNIKKCRITRKSDTFFYIEI